MRFMTIGAAQVPDNSATTAPILIQLTSKALNPVWSR